MDKADVIIQSRNPIDTGQLKCPICGKTGYMLFDSKNSRMSNGQMYQRYVCSRESSNRNTGFMCGGTIDIVKEDRLAEARKANAQKFLKRDSSGKFVSANPKNSTKEPKRVSVKKSAKNTRR